MDFYNQICSENKIDFEIHENEDEIFKNKKSLFVVSKNDLIFRIFYKLYIIKFKLNTIL